LTKNKKLHLWWHPSKGVDNTSTPPESKLHWIILISNKVLQLLVFEQEFNMGWITRKILIWFFQFIKTI